MSILVLLLLGCVAQLCVSTQLDEYVNAGPDFLNYECTCPVPAFNCTH